MARDKLVVEEGPNGWYLQWWIADWQDLGGCLGDNPTPYTENDLKNARDEDWETIRASIVVAPLASGRDLTGYFWNTVKGARAALKVANAALKDRSLRLMPEWATKALAEGWKPPKGWKP